MIVEFETLTSLVPILHQPTQHHIEVVHSVPGAAEESKKKTHLKMAVESGKRTEMRAVEVSKTQAYFQNFD